MARIRQLTSKGTVKMVDIGAKPVTEREARASCKVIMKPETLKRIINQQVEKGNVLEVARLAGIMAAKRTAEIIPLCHPLSVSFVGLELKAVEEKSCLTIQSRVRLSAKTGAEMEALTAVAVAGLTVYDMCKGIDKQMAISDIKLVMKKGGRSGLFVRKD